MKNQYDTSSDFTKGLFIEEAGKKPNHRTPKIGKIRKSLSSSKNITLTSKKTPNESAEGNTTDGVHMKEFDIYNAIKRLKAKNKAKKVESRGNEAQQLYSDYYEKEFELKYDK
jgi:hypothetical protein